MADGPPNKKLKQSSLLTFTTKTRGAKETSVVPAAIPGDMITSKVLFCILLLLIDDITGI